MTHKEAIKELKADIELYDNEIVRLDAFKDTPDRRLIDALEMAIKALEKQIPTEPFYEADGYADGELVYDTWYCPNCNISYEVDFDDYDFCPNCGQAIKADWSEEE